MSPEVAAVTMALEPDQPIFLGNSHSLVFSLKEPGAQSVGIPSLKTVNIDSKRETKTRPNTAGKEAFRGWMRPHGSSSSHSWVLPHRGTDGRTDLKAVEPDGAKTRDLPHGS